MFPGMFAYLQNSTGGITLPTTRPTIDCHTSHGTKFGAKDLLKWVSRGYRDAWRRALA